MLLCDGSTLFLGGLYKILGGGPFEIATDMEALPIVINPQHAIDSEIFHRTPKFFPREVYRIGVLRDDFEAFEAVIVDFLDPKTYNEDMRLKSAYRASSLNFLSYIRTYFYTHQSAELF